MSGVFYHSAIHGLGFFVCFNEDVIWRKTIKHTFAMFYLSNRPQVSMVYRLKTTRDVGRTREEFVNHKRQASDLGIL